MTAASYSTNLSDIFTDGGTGTWTSIGTGGAGLTQETDFFIQGSSCMSKSAFASSEKGMIHDNSGDAGGSGTDGAYIAWMTHLTPNSLATIAAGGMKFLIGSGSNAYRQFYVGGKDTLEFGGWVLVAVNENATADNTTGSPTAGVESWFGGLWNLPSGGPTKGAPAAIDGIRYGRADIVITNGTAPDAAASFSGILTNLETASLRYGMLALRDGAYFNSGLMQLGTSGTAVRFEESNKTIFIRQHPHATANFNTWEVVNASSSVTLTSCAFKALGTTTPGRWLNTDNATVALTGCSFVDMGTFTFLSNTTASACNWLGCDQIDAGGATMTNSTVGGYEGTADTSALVWNVATDPNGKLDGMVFTKGTASTHAIEFGTSSPLTMTLTDIDFSGYNASDGQTDSALYFARTTGTINITMSGTTPSVPSYKSAGATINVIAGAVTVSVTATESDGTAIQNARVLLRASNGTGPFPYDETVTISNSGTTATVTHTSHGMATNDYVQITGGDLEENNGVFQITVTDANTYTYTMSSAPTGGSGTPTVVQGSYAQVTGNNTSEILLGTTGSFDSNVTAGSTLILTLTNTDTNTRTYSVSDDVDGAWTALTKSILSGVETQIFYKTNHSGGATTVTVSSNFGAVKRVSWLEITASSADQDSNYVGAVDATFGYPCSADATVIDTGANVFVVAALALNATGSIDTVTSPWTEMYNDGVRQAHKYRSSDTALTNERGFFAESGTNRTAISAIASFTGTGGGTPSPTGTIKATFAALYGLTDGSGNISTSRVYSSNQPVTGWSRKSSSSPYYQQGVLNGTVNSSTGFAGSAVMISDE